MKIISYNLGYGRGLDGSFRDYVLKSHRVLHQNIPTQKEILNPVADLISLEQPDLFTYSESTTGSFRNRNFNQHQYLVDKQRGAITESAVCKYGSSILKKVPFHVGNSNGVISFREADIREHYLRRSRKKLVYEVVMEDITVFTVHLSLFAPDRRAQMVELSRLVNRRKGNVVICGDFNILGGLNELDFLTKETSLRVAGEGLVTYPARRPVFQLDIFLYRFSEPRQEPKIRVIDLSVSDHLPVIFEC